MITYLQNLRMSDFIPLSEQYQVKTGLTAILNTDLQKLHKSRYVSLHHRNLHQ